MEASGRVNILLVDDRPENLVALESVLDELGQNLVRATSGKEALKRLLEDDYAVILLDVQMPEMDGFETASLIRQRERSRDIPIIFLTAINKSDVHVSRGYSVGAIDYVLKPFDPDILRAKVAAFVQLWKKTHELQQEIQRRRAAEKEVRRLNEDLERRVAARTAELQATNRELESEIAERTRTEAELYRAKEAAEVAVRAKTQFLASMSHELRTPLNAIIGFSELLEDRTFGALNERQLKYVGNILSSGRHLLQLINDILDVAKVEAGRMRLDRSCFNVAAALQDAVAIIRTLAARKEIDLTLAVDPQVAEISADPSRFRQILYNLLSNAIKFTPGGGSVNVTARLLQGDSLPEEGPNRGAGDWLMVSVSDTGIGILPEDRERIFGEFEQIDSSYARHQEGTGLGLALTLRLVALHGGRIWLEGEGEGKGSTFSFVLPVDGAAEQDGAPAAPSAVPALP
jgi:signal transduction histidine kinase